MVTTKIFSLTGVIFLAGERPYFKKIIVLPGLRALNVQVSLPGMPINLAVDRLNVALTSLSIFASNGLATRHLKPITWLDSRLIIMFWPDSTSILVSDSPYSLGCWA